MDIEETIMGFLTMECDDMLFGKFIFQLKHQIEPNEKVGKAQFYHKQQLKI